MRRNIDTFISNMGWVEEDETEHHVSNECIDVSSNLD